MAALRALAAQKSEAHRSRFVGRELDAITLHTPAALAALGRTSALTENFLPVEIAAPLPANQLVRVRVTGLTAEGALYAELVADRPAEAGRIPRSRRELCPTLLPAPSRHESSKTASF